jgi:hypothetical protein
MNIRAGYRFHPRKPTSAPDSAASTATIAGPSSAPNVSATPAAAMAVTPAARPSMLSSRLTALSRPPKQRIASTVNAACIGVAAETVTIERTKKAATASELTIFASADNDTTSSNKPTTKSASPARRIGQAGAASPPDSAAPATTPMNTPRPPYVGVGT